MHSAPTIASRTMDLKHVYERFYFSFQLPTAGHCSFVDENQTIRIKMHEHCCEAKFEDILVSPSSLEEVYRFCCFLKRTINSKPTADIVFFVGPVLRIQVGSAFLLGCYMILALGLSVKETWEHFEELESSSIVTYECSEGLNLMDFWGAVSHARFLI